VHGWRNRLDGSGSGCKIESRPVRTIRQAWPRCWLAPADRQAAPFCAATSTWTSCGRSRRRCDALVSTYHRPGPASPPRRRSVPIDSCSRVLQWFLAMSLQGASRRRGPPADDDLHAAMAKLIKADFGELIWRDRRLFGQIAADVSPLSGRTYLYDAVAAGKLSAAKWLVRLGGRVREPQGGSAPLPSPWQAALLAADPLPMLRTLLTSDSLKPGDLGLCADDLLALRQRASSAREVTAAHETYCETCRRIGRDPGPAPPEIGYGRMAAG
jgi:hypothetical protein